MTDDISDRDLNSDLDDERTQWLLHELLDSPPPAMFDDLLHRVTRSMPHEVDDSLLPDPFTDDPGTPDHYVDDMETNLVDHSHEHGDHNDQPFTAFEDLHDHVHLAVHEDDHASWSDHDDG